MGPLKYHFLISLLIVSTVAVLDDDTDQEGISALDSQDHNHLPGFYLPYMDNDGFESSEYHLDLRRGFMPKVGGGGIGRRRHSNRGRSQIRKTNLNQPTYWRVGTRMQFYPEQKGHQTSMPMGNDKLYKMFPHLAPSEWRRKHGYPVE